MKLIATLLLGTITQQFAFIVFDASPAESFIAYLVGIILAKQIWAEVPADDKRNQNG
ncbi:hypothetical protein [Paenibacillus sp. UASWS1643]|uniref:hypothetical protein n=1 Tax=Paenibacillus sp. UASWS1643 TaxID=2580422 RepID=UPI0016876CE2|nr:hypothetical protein [Paenibacillus sp. UASWS1643]